MAPPNQNIIRTPKDAEHPYLAISRTVAQDRRLSYEARGVMLYLLSKPNDWEVRPADLEQDGCKRDKVYRILAELKEYGYLVRERARTADGRMEWLPYRVCEQPSPLTEKPEMDEPLQEALQPFTEKPEVAPYTGLPDTVLPYTEKPHIYKVERVQSRELTKERNAPRKSADAPPPPASPHQAIMSAYAEVLGYPIRDGAKEGNAAKWLVNNSYTAEQVTACYQAMSQDDFWQGKHISLQSVAKQIGAWAKARAKPPPGAVTASKPLPDMQAELEARRRKRAEEDAAIRASRNGLNHERTA